MVALAWLQTVSPTLQTMGSIGVMLMAGVLLLLVGLMVVAVWQGGDTSVVEQFSTGSQSSSDSVEERPDTVDPGDGQSGTAATSAVEDEAESVELTDEEVILDILEDNDGRMKQARIVDETGWSKSKVSMLLSEMEDDGDITKLRVGRENIISLSGNEPDAAGSPFDSQ